MQENIILLILTIVFSGFFSGAEVALVSVSKLRARQLAESKVRNAKYLNYLKENFTKTLIAILIGNNVVNIGGSAIATQIALLYFDNLGVAIATGIMTFLILTFGEIIPKTFAAKHAVKMSLNISPIIYALMFVLSPIIWGFHKFSVFINKFGKQGQDEYLVTEQELKYMVRLGEQQGQIKPDEKEMIQNILRFDDTYVEEVMTPRTEIFALDQNMKIKDAMQIIIDQSFSRIPVFEENLDKIKGIVMVKDLLTSLNKKTKAKRLKDIAKPAIFVPENKKIDSLLKELQKESSHMAVVVNEHGGVEGIVTIEDLLEEIVGDIFDESDEVEHLVLNIAKKKWKVLGKAPIRFLNKRLKLSLPTNDDYNTLAGLIQEKLGKVPASGDVIVFDDKKIRITVKQMDGPIIIETVLEKI
ncbi:MAG: hemolysin family protein [Candidatus Woesearchaeota archaeon]